MTKRILESLFLLLYLDYLMRFRGFQALHSAVRAQTVSPVPTRVDDDRALSRAVDLACVLYFKPVRCLQRSCAAALLLRRYGWPASMVIGAQLLPFQSHAWVEIDGRVVNDKPYVHQMFQILERC
jgi:hypothetical protein